MQAKLIYCCLGEHGLMLTYIYIYLAGELTWLPVIKEYYWEVVLDVCVLFISPYINLINSVLSKY